MTLLHFPSCCFTNKPHLLLQHKPLFYTPNKPILTIISQKSSQSPEQPNITNDPISETNPIPSSGKGFGPAQLPKPNASPTSSSTGKKKGSKEIDRIIRRSPVEKPSFLGKKGEVDEIKEPTFNDTAFLYTWLGLGALILLEGLSLAASGFLPEEWDKLFVKFVYPSFTPTVFLFVAGSVVYGVVKYFENENARNQK